MDHGRLPQEMFLYSAQVICNKARQAGHGDAEGGEFVSKEDRQCNQQIAASRLLQTLALYSVRWES